MDRHCKIFSLQDYLELVDSTGRVIREDKRGAIPLHYPPILDRLKLNPEDWFSNATQFEQLYAKSVIMEERHYGQAL